MKTLPNRISLNAWIANYQIEQSTIHSIQLLIEKPDKFYIAVNWSEQHNKHFNLFKHQEQAHIKIFSRFIARTNRHWYEQLSHWLNHPMATLKLQ